MNIETNREILNLKSKVNLNCSICDKCCEYRGDIKITPINVLEISKFLKIPIEQFLEKYTIEAEDEPPEFVIKGIGEKRNCIFNDKENYKCKINKVKPLQCIVFPLVPIDINRNLFINSNACKVNTKKFVTVDKWINGNNKNYNRNKNIYLKWIEFMEEIQPKWKHFSREKQETIRELLFKEYDLKRNFENQIIENIKKVREIIYTKSY